MQVHKAWVNIIFFNCLCQLVVLKSLQSLVGRFSLILAVLNMCSKVIYVKILWNICDHPVGFDVRVSFCGGLVLKERARCGISAKYVL